VKRRASEETGKTTKQTFLPAHTVTMTSLPHIKG
jgi:hypothetical protein